MNSMITAINLSGPILEKMGRVRNGLGQINRKGHYIFNSWAPPYFRTIQLRGRGRFDPRFGDLGPEALENFEISIILNAQKLHFPSYHEG